MKEVKFKFIPFNKMKTGEIVFQLKLEMIYFKFSQLFQKLT